MTTGAATSPIVTLRPNAVGVRRSQALAPNIQFPAGNRCFRLNLGNLRFAVGIFADCHRY